jgi:hypothetical protein
MAQAPASTSAAGAFPDIDALKLEDYVRAAAIALRTKFPQVMFTSGRRDVAGQAQAMASNVVKNRKWIKETYKESAMRTRLQAWVDANPGAGTIASIAAGLLATMKGFPTELAGFSEHLTGEAFDVQPVPGPDGDAIKAAMRALPNLFQFLPIEGGLVRWHAEFRRT